MTFDWSTGTMNLDQLCEDGSVAPMADVPAAGVGLQADAIIVTSTVVGRRAEAGGLTPGESVVAINGEEVSDSDRFCALAATAVDTIATEDGQTYQVGDIAGFLLME